MALLSISNLAMSIGDTELFAGVNLTLGTAEHVAMIGRNGCGKTSLLRAIVGSNTPPVTEGQIQLPRRCSVGYLQQQPSFDGARTLRAEAAAATAQQQDLQHQLNQVAAEMAGPQGPHLERLLRRYESLERQLDAAGGFAIDHKIDATLAGLGLTEAFFDVAVADLSGGQRGRLALAKLLLAQPQLLLLDEPTNHLDLAGRQWLEGFLEGFAGALIVVSHDRTFIDRVVTKIYELEEGELVEYPGHYTQFRQLRDLRHLTQQRNVAKQREMIRREQQYIDRYRAGQRARQARGRQKRLDRMIRDELLDQPAELRSINIQVKPRVRSGDLVLRSHQISKAYEDKTLFENLSLEIRRGDRIGIVGPNGCGKSTLARCLLGHQELDAGSVHVGAQVQPGMFTQTHETIDLSQSVVQYLRQFVESEQAARDLAGAFLFTGLEQEKTVDVLSGGELSRMVLAGLIVSGHNLLVLDEPTNHLDIPSVERLEAALDQFCRQEKSQDNLGTLLLITHDRMLLDALVSQLLIFDGNGQVRHFMGSYGEFERREAEERSAKREAREARGEARQAPRSGRTQRRKSKKKPQIDPSGAAGDQWPTEAALRLLSQSALEKRIMDIETRLGEIDKQLSDPRAHQKGHDIKALKDQRHQLAAQLAPLEAEWARRA